MTSNTHRAFLGVGEYDFALTPPMIVELERITEAGIGAILARLTDRRFKHRDLVETIRLALIGGGTSPQRAGEIVAAYVVPRPLAETYPLALSILEALWFGADASGAAE
ncbi:MAG TPA: gene transfer agent family protein [Hyphomicrobium sp.]|nr:gene transfer agent family protein [Hyphomicrobium sp.]